MMFPAFRGLLYVALIVAASNQLTASPSTLRTAAAAPAEEAPVIDGIVDDEVWKKGQLITDFVQAEPYEGQPATERTEVRIVYDNRNLYVGVVCYDNDPSGIIVTDSRRDASLDDTDSFQIILDTYLDRQNGFVFGTNPAGIEYDGQVTNEGEGGQGQPGSGRSQTGSGGGFNLNWDASWIVATRMGDYGWSAEFAIPLRTLRYGAGKPQVWGLNFQRNIRRKREEVYWSPVSRIYNLYRLSSAGELHGLELETPRNFKVTPYVLGSSERDYTTSDTNDLNGDFGVDAKFGVSPSLNLDLTYNTDFAQVEVDEQQINLTRFNLFFPEKRPFFLENAGNFAMGLNQSVELFFSRRIGIGPDGTPVPILGGARLSGKAGAYNVGVLNMQTEEVAELTSANNYTVASLSREFPNRSGVGALFVNRLGTGDLAGDDNWNRTWGVDGKLGVGEAFTLTGFAARTETPNVGGREHAFNARAEYEKRAGRVALAYTEVGDDFNPEVGFLTRNDYRNLEGTVFLNIRNDISWLRELRPHVTYDGFWDFTGFKQSERIHVDSHVDFESGAFFSPAMNHTVEGLTEPFGIFPGILVRPGTYTNWEAAWRWNTNQAAPFSYSGGWDFGGFLSGNRTGLETTLNYRYQSKVITSVTWEYNDIDLAEGSFVTNLGQLRVAYNFTPLIYLQALVQYNDRADAWSSNIRFSWLNTAGTGLFVVYNDTEGLGDVLIGPQNRSFIVKYTHQFDILR
ncbi:MAG TPA: DUF5916 domain-containing protein [Vicinamibacteria bacterium]|nr:DUF5916 domain-containing protein [Vicinamibacteria bacterium]